MSAQRVVSDAQRTYADLFAAPPGEQFLTGVLMTHDLNSALVDEALARLCGVETSDERRRRVETRSAFMEGAVAGTDYLLVIAAADRIGPVPAVPGVRVVGVTGRRMHAKCALLVFWSPEKNVVTTVRAVVTSANLTASGLLVNREVLLHEDIRRGAKSTPGGLAAGVCSMLRRLRSKASEEEMGLMPCDGKVVKYALEQAHRLVPKAHQPLTIRHSLLAQQAVVGRFKGPAKRVIIVSPPFAGAGSGAVDEIRHLLSPSTQVDLYIGNSSLRVGRGESPVFSPSTLDALRQQAKVRLFLVPDVISDNDGLPRLRPLHAKLIAVLDGSPTAVVFTGSANFTASGLGGRNRELMAQFEMPAHELLQFIDELDAVRYDGATSNPPAEQVMSTIRKRPRLSPEFEILPGQDAGATSWRGRLTVDVAYKQRPVAMIVNGERYPVPKFGLVHLDIELREADGTVEFEWLDGGVTRHVVVVKASSTDEQFWRRIGSPDPDVNPNREFLDALFDLRRPATTPTSPTTPGAASASGTAATSGGFRIPLAQRLVVLARHRVDLMKELGLPELQSRLGNFITDPAELEVAVALLQFQFGAKPAKVDPLIDEFCRQLVCQVQEADEE